MLNFAEEAHDHSQGKICVKRTLDLKSVAAFVNYL